MKKIGVLRYDVPIAPVIGEVLAGDPASRDGLLAGDFIETVDGSVVQDWAEVVAAVRAAPARPVEFGIVRDGQQLMADPPITNVVRQVEIPDPVQQVNEQWRDLLEGSVWFYYQMIGTQNANINVPDVPNPNPGAGVRGAQVSNTNNANV